MYQSLYMLFNFEATSLKSEMIHAIVLKKPTFDLPITVHIMSIQKNFNQSIFKFSFPLTSNNQASFPTRKTPFSVEMICTIWPGHTYSPSIVMLFLIQSGPTKVNSKSNRFFNMWYNYEYFHIYLQSNYGLECNIHVPKTSFETHYTTNSKESGLKCSNMIELTFLPPIPIIRMKF